MIEFLAIQVDWSFSRWIYAREVPSWQETYNEIPFDGDVLNTTEPLVEKILKQTGSQVFYKTEQLAHIQQRPQEELERAVIGHSVIGMRPLDAASWQAQYLALHEATPTAYFSCYTADGGGPIQCGYPDYEWVVVEVDHPDTCPDEITKLINEYVAKLVFDSSNRNLPFVPACDQFTHDDHSAHYTFSELNLGDNASKKDKCGHAIPAWALLAPALLAPATDRRGLDKWVDGIMEDPIARSIGEPKLNSAYRGPARNTCVGGASGSRHMFGDAADLAVSGNDAARMAIVQRWHKIARVKAKADWTETATGLPCSTKPGTAAENWKCAHADWRGAPDRIQSESSAAVVSAETTGAPPRVTAAMRAASQSPDWRVRQRVFDGLRIFPSELDAAAAQLANPRNDSAVGQLLLNLLRIEQADGTPNSEEREDYLLALTTAAARLAGQRAVPLILDAGQVMKGRSFWRSAAELGDRGVAPLLTLMANRAGDAYVDYLGVACTMLQPTPALIRKAENKKKLYQEIVGAVSHSDILARYLAAECLPRVPWAQAVPLLRQLRDRDPDASVKSQAKASLTSMGF